MNPFDPNDKLAQFVNKYPLAIIGIMFFLAMMMDSL
jgi:hypothetical protein